MSQAKTLANLLQEAEQLTADIGGDEELPRVKRNLQQIAEAGQRLLSKTTVGLPEDHTDVKASILLGSRGFDVPKLSQRIETLNATKTLEPIEPVWETDIEGFLRNERENTLLAVIEESRKNTFNEADQRQWQSMESSWEEEKEKILNSLLGSNQDTIELPSHSETIIADPLSMMGRSALDAVEMAYAREVYRANEAELHDLSHALVTEFCNASKNFTDKSIKNSWELLKTLVDVPTLPPKAFEHRSSIRLQKDFVNQARHFLEEQYREYIRDLVYSNLSQSQLGGVPGTLQLVRSYLNLKQATSIPGLEDGLVQGQPLWALVFYCMRCGDLEAALSALSESQVCGDIVPYLEEYKDSNDWRLSSSLENRLQLLYKKSVRSSSDPFKKAVYCVLARCELNDNHSQVLVTTEDYMWLKLCQVHFEVTEHGDHMTLSKLQRFLLKEYGEGHFQAQRHPHLYFQVLLLTAQFEAAIEFLSRVESLRSHAVHFALALHDLDLLYLTPSFHSNLMIEEPNGLQRLNLGRLVVSYTRKFALTDPREALEYFYRLRTLKDGQEKNLFLSCVSDLVTESREFEMLLGQVQPDGSRKPGCIDKFGNKVEELNVQTIINFVATETENHGRFEDAIRLYDLAQEYGKVLELLCHLMGGVVSAPSPPQSDRHRLKNLAVSIAERYRNLGYAASHQISHTFFLLLDLMLFFDSYHAKRIDEALEIMKELRLLPLQLGETVEQKVSAFRIMDDLIRQCFPDVLLAVMSILYTMYKQISSTPLRGGRGSTPQGGQEMHKTQLRSLAHTLITFAGMIPYQMSGDINARLVQMEILMN